MERGAELLNVEICYFNGMFRFIVVKPDSAGVERRGERAQFAFATAVKNRVEYALIRGQQGENPVRLAE